MSAVVTAQEILAERSQHKAHVVQLEQLLSEALL
jgi:hypothetical protein